MALIIAADFRSASFAEYCADLLLTDQEAPTSALTAAIARLTARLEDWTNDLYTSTPLTLDIDGLGGQILRLPYRTTAVTAVKFRLADGTYSASQAAASYRLSSSLNAAGDTEVSDFDYLEAVPYSAGFTTSTASSTPYAWPTGPRIVQVAGTFGWTTAPGDAKRAVAMLVWDHFKPIRADLGRAQSWQAADLSVNVSATDIDHPSGIPRVDEIIVRLRRNSYVGVS